MRLHAQVFALLATLLAVSTPAMATVVFAPREIEIIREYYSHAQQDAGRAQQDAGKAQQDAGKAQQDAGKAKSGKHKQQGLPPGVAKNLARGKPLPPGIAKQQLPGDLSRRLPPVRDGYERIIVDERVLLVEIATQMIVDAIFD